MNPQAIASIRWSTDGKYHVTRIDVQCGYEPWAWLPHCRKFPMLRQIRLLGPSQGTAEHIQLELQDLPVRVEYRSGGDWVPVSRKS